MNKVKFLDELKKGLRKFNQEDIDNAVEFYDQLISDKMIEENISEEKAVKNLGDINEIIKKTSADLIVNKKYTSSPKGAIITLGLIFGSPFLLTLGIVLAALYFTLFVTILSLFVGFGGSAIGCIITIFQYAFSSLVWGEKLLLIGVTLIYLAVFISLMVVVKILGFKLIDFINVKIVKRFLKGEKNESK